MGLLRVYCGVTSFPDAQKSEKSEEVPGTHGSHMCKEF